MFLGEGAVGADLGDTIDWAERQGAKGRAWTCPDTEEQ